jgi:hypothetical protein
MLLDEPTMPDHERALLARASDWPQHRELAELTVQVLSDVAAREGIDFATALLYERVCASHEHGPFIRAIDDLLDDTSPVADPPFRLAIVPGAFYKEFPASGADGRLIREAAMPLGIEVDTIPVQSFGSIDANAQIIADWLQAQDRGSTVLVSLSKGGSDVKLALARPDAGTVFCDVIAWVNLSGILYGTPLVSWVLRSKLRTWWFRFLLWMRGFDFDVVRQLDCTADSPLRATVALPDMMRAIHVVGFPMREHLTNSLARRWYRRICDCGPNDGAGILLGDITRTPGHVYPIWGADHYLRPRGRDPIKIARAILVHLVRSSGGFQPPLPQCSDGFQPPEKERRQDAAATRNTPPLLERCR